MHKHDIIVVGASAGGVEALISLVRGLPPDLPAALFIVLHIPSHGTSILPDILSRRGPLPAHHPRSGERIEHGRIYVAPNDHHLLVKDGYVELSSGPRENGFRPAIDSLFRTAAHAYGPRVVGVLLTGLLDNGVAGLVAIKDHGGTVVVQDPADALFPSMPINALRVVTADYVLRLAQIPQILTELASQDVSDMEAANLPGDEDPIHKRDNETAETATNESLYQEKLGIPSGMICPECGGALVEFQSGNEGRLISFHCRVGHRYSLHSMLERQGEAAEAALWAAVRALEESSTVAQRMQEYARQNNDLLTMERFAARMREADRNADIIRQLLVHQSSGTSAP